ncbi:MAG: response regulator [Candidatus Omnitrophica bacterium]|nr:response regulator [Candidatus Omnitrophota bacterium]
MAEEKKKRILIIEDNRELSMLEEKVLQKSGYDVFRAYSAQEGIDLAVKEVPDLIIMDIRLPYKKKGIGAARIIRDNERTSGIPILFVTGYAEGEDTAEIGHIPHCGYLVKPFDVEVFLEEIKKCMGIG